MYRSDLNNRDKGGAIIGAVAIQAALLLAFMNIQGHLEFEGKQSAMQLVSMVELPPPVPVVKSPSSRTKTEGGSQPKNIKSEATPVVAPEPIVRLPAVKQIAASLTPRQGADATQGAADVRGPGTGAGGQGNGNGSGNGSGSGDGGGVAEPPHLATPVLRGYDFPRQMLQQWPRAATVFLRLRVDARGYVAECLLDRGTNVPEIDAQMCNTAHERLRFRPALNRSGEAVAGWFGYAQPAPR